MTSPFVYIIVLNWNRKYDTLECLESLQDVCYPNYKVLVVDNGSTDGSSYIIRKRFPNITLIENEKNLGFAEGNNVAIRHALREGADYILLLNNDTVIDKQLLMELVKIAESDLKIGICGPKIYYYNAPNTIWFAGGLIKRGIAFHIGDGEDDQGQHDKITFVDYITGCAMMIKRKLVEKVGLLDPDYFCMFEDADLCHRGRKAGFKVVYGPTAKVWHKISLSFGGMLSPLWVYYKVRNNILFMRKNERGSGWLTFSLYFAKLFLILLVRSVVTGDYQSTYYLIKGFLGGVCYNLRS